MKPDKILERLKLTPEIIAKYSKVIPAPPIVKPEKNKKQIAPRP